MEFGVDTMCYHRHIAAGMSLERVVAEVAGLGVGWIQINRYHLRGDESPARIERIGRQARDLGLKVIWSGDNLGKAGVGAAGLERVRAGIEQASAAGAAILRMFPAWFRLEALPAGRLPDELRYLRELLAAAVPLLEAAGITLALENHANVSAPEMVALLQEVQSPRVRVHLDVVNQIAAFEDPIDAARRLAPYTVSVHLKDVQQESRWGTESYYRMGYMVRYCWPGEGMFPLADALAALLAQGVRVPLVLEGLDEPEDPAAKARRSLDYLRRTIAGITAR